jgi:Zn-dependent membrane protease YugP
MFINGIIISFNAYMKLSIIAYSITVLPNIYNLPFLRTKYRAILKD